MDHIKIAFAFLVAAISITSISAQRCWQCTAEVRATADMTKQAQCVTGNFSEQLDASHQVECPENKCITYSTVSTDYDPSYITRGCLYKRKQQNKMCDGHAGIKDVFCCDGNLCNKADAATYVQFITVLLITTSALVTMLFVMI